jgi:hypothetical protein
MLLQDSPLYIIDFFNDPNHHVNLDNIPLKPLITPFTESNGVVALSLLLYLRFCDTPACPEIRLPCKTGEVVPDPTARSPLPPPNVGTVPAQRDSLPSSCCCVRRGVWQLDWWRERTPGAGAIVQAAVVVSYDRFGQSPALEYAGTVTGCVPDVAGIAQCPHAQGLLFECFA